MIWIIKELGWNKKTGKQLAARENATTHNGHADATDKIINNLNAQILLSKPKALSCPHTSKTVQTCRYHHMFWEVQERLPSPEACAAYTGLGIFLDQFWNEYTRRLLCRNTRRKFIGCSSLCYFCLYDGAKVSWHCEFSV